PWAAAASRPDAKPRPRPRASGRYRRAPPRKAARRTSRSGGVVQRLARPAAEAPEERPREPPEARRPEPELFLPDTVSLRLLPALKAGYWLAGMLIFSVVPGLTPVRALRLRTSKVPKPVRVTLLPLAMFSVIVSRSESIVSFTAFLDSPVFSATSLTSSALLTVLVLAIGELLSRTRPEYRAWVTAKRQIGTMAVGTSTRRARAGRRPTFAPVRRRPGGIVCDAMTGEMLTVMLVLLGAVALFVSDRVRLDVVALLVILALTLTGSLTPAQALAGFADPLVVMIAALFVVSGALVQTGVADAFGRALGRLAGGGETRMVVAVKLATGLLSAFMSSTGTV